MSEPAVTETSAADLVELTPEEKALLAGNMNDRVARFLAIETEIDELELATKLAKKRKLVVERALLDEFKEAGIQNQKMNGRLVYLHRTPYADVKDGVSKEEIIEVLDEIGLGDVAKRTLSSTQLTALVKEFDAEGEGALPDELAAKIDVGERYSIRSRKG